MSSKILYLMLIETTFICKIKKSTVKPTHNFALLKGDQKVKINNYKFIHYVMQKFTAFLLRFLFLL